MDTLRNYRDTILAQAASLSSETLPWFSDLVREIKSYIDKTYKRRAHNYSLMKRLCREAGLSDTSLAATTMAQILRETRKEKALSDERAKKAVEARNRNVFIQNIDSILSRIQMLTQSSDAADWFVALQLSCGARQSEILSPNVSSFSASVVDGKQEESFIVQTGMAKKRDLLSTYQLRKPLLGLDSETFLLLLASTRACFGISGRKIPCSVNAELSRVTKHYFPYEKRTGTHLNRALYASACAFLRPQDSQAAVIKDVLGHSNLNTAPHYMNVSVTDSVETPTPCLIEITGENGICQVEFCPRRRGQITARRLKLRNIITQFEEAGVPCTYANFARVGFSRRFVDTFFSVIKE